MYRPQNNLLTVGRADSIAGLKVCLGNTVTGIVPGVNNSPTTTEREGKLHQGANFDLVGLLASAVGKAAKCHLVTFSLSKWWQ